MGIFTVCQEIAKRNAEGRDTDESLRRFHMKGKEDRAPETRGEQSLPTASSHERRRKERVWKVAAVTAYKGRGVVKEYLHKDHFHSIPKK